MNKFLQITVCCFIFSSSFSQYYLRGEVKDENNNSLSNAKILLHSNNYLYYSDTSGVFEILIPGPSDTVTISANGYKPLSLFLEAGQYQYIMLNALYNPHAPGGRQLLTFTKNMYMGPAEVAQGGDDDLSSFVENQFAEACQFPETNFAVNTEKVSYSNLKRYINMNSIVPRDAIRVEELLNYFKLDYKEPPNDSNFAFDSYISKCPWNEKNQLLFFRSSAKKIDLEKIPPSNIVLLIDVSGSMALPNRLPLLKTGLRFLVNNLREKDTVSIVTYGKATSVWLSPTPGNLKKQILKAIEELKPGGSQPGDAAIKEAYIIAENQFIKDGNNRIILASDGDFPIGQSTQEELEKLIMMHKRWGIYFSCLGLGMGNNKDEKLHVLAERGNGNMSYIEDEKQAEKALLREFAQIVYSVAERTYFTLTLDSNIVKSYRLIGFENRIEALDDSAAEITGGEVGSGSSMMALLEIIPVVKGNAINGRIGTITMHYKLPGDSTKRFSYYDLPSQFTKFSSLPPPYRFASSVALIGGLMKNSHYTNNYRWSDAVSVASQSFNDKDVAQKEFMTLIQKAKKIYAKEKKEK
ncbi:MAG TPA: von Willebrand factor type A domain-containing protein [Puia sp.]|nr:von Willebrand factor type A domain-containing protein [Puia sp.]